MKSRSRVAWLVLVLAVALAVALRAPILTALGSYLIKAGPPVKADTILVLAGDPYGNRILRAAELVRDGYAPKVLVSGPEGIYGNHECDLAIPFAVKHGFPESYFEHLENSARSTEEEARMTTPELHRRGARRVLLVTSDYHTRRAGKLFHATAPDLTFLVVAAPDHDFRADAWWRSRQGQKVFALEWEKTIAAWFGI